MSVLLAGGLLEPGSRCKTEAGEGCDKGVNKTQRRRIIKKA
jgi:hypothetical protein